MEEKPYLYNFIDLYNINVCERVKYVKHVAYNICIF